MFTLKDVLTDTTEKMASTLRMLKEQFAGLRTGKASPALVENVSVIAISPSVLFPPGLSQDCHV